MTYIASKCKKIDLACERLTHLDITVGHLRIFGFAVLAILLDRFFDFFVPKNFSFSVLVCIAVCGFSVFPTATRRVLLSTEHCQSFFINAIPKLVTKSQATRN